MHKREARKAARIPNRGILLLATLLLLAMRHLSANVPVKRMECSRHRVVSAAVIAGAGRVGERAANVKDEFIASQVTRIASTIEKL